MNITEKSNFAMKKGKKVNTSMKSILGSCVLLGALLGLPLQAASSQEGEKDFGSERNRGEAIPFEIEGQQAANRQNKAVDDAVTCDSNYCTGLTTELFKQYHISGAVRAVVKSDAVKALMAAKGCEQTYSVYLPEATDARDLMLKQFMIAEALNTQVKVRIIKSSTGVHCVFGSMWRFNQ